MSRNNNTRREGSKAPPGSPVLRRAFFDRPAVVLARDLIGARIVRRCAQGEECFTITETEAYLGPHDLACHSARGRTRRNEVMFGPPGTLYIYLVYGLHLMLNVVAGPQNAGSAVLIRSAGSSRGPGRLGKALNLSMTLNGQIAAPETGLWFEEGEGVPHKVTLTPRIGVNYAGPRWARRKLRFVLAN
jgi:DNA-3-methyladenine glycosylase